MVEYKNPRLRVALITLDAKGRILLLQHTRPHGVYWVLPGGGLDAGEKIEDALKREIREELSVDCEISKLVAVGELIQPDRHVVDFFLTGKIPDGAEFIVQKDEGITDVGWFTPDEISEMVVLPDEIVSILSKIEKCEECKKCGIFHLGKYKNSPESLST